MASLTLEALKFTEASVLTTCPAEVGRTSNITPSTNFFSVSFFSEAGFTSPIVCGLVASRVSGTAGHLMEHIKRSELAMPPVLPGRGRRL